MFGYEWTIEFWVWPDCLITSLFWYDFTWFRCYNKIACTAGVDINIFRYHFVPPGFHATFLMDIMFIFNPRSGMYSRHIYTSPNSLVHHYTCSSRRHHLIIYLGRVNGSIMTCINVTLFHLNFSSMIYQPRALNYSPHLQLQGMSIMYHYPPSKNHFYT